MLEQGMMNFALLGAGWVLWLLVLLSFGVVAISIERLVYMIMSGSSRGALATAVDAFLGGGEVEVFQKKLKTVGGAEARVLSVGLELADQGPDAVEKAMSATSTAEKLKMERGLSYLATVGSNAPFIGLFGTVLGILVAFHDLSQNMSEASEAVMGGIAEALVATAVGLGVAIPSVVLYNLFTRWVKSRLARASSVGELVLARLTDGRHG